MPRKLVNQADVDDANAASGRGWCRDFILDADAERAATWR